VTNVRKLTGVAVLIGLMAVPLAAQAPADARQMRWRFKCSGPEKHR
jgi:hypothetical protein